LSCVESLLRQCPDRWTAYTNGDACDMKGRGLTTTVELQTDHSLTRRYRWTSTVSMSSVRCTWTKRETRQRSVLNGSTFTTISDPTIVSQVPLLWFYTIISSIEFFWVTHTFFLATVIIMLKCLKLHLSQMLRSLFTVGSGL